MTQKDITNLKVGNILVNTKSLKKGIRCVIVVNQLRPQYVHFDHIDSNGGVSKGPSQIGHNFLEEEYDLLENVVNELPNIDSFYVKIPELIHNLKKSHTSDITEIVNWLSHYDAWNPNGELNKLNRDKLISDALNEICVTKNEIANKG